MDNDQVKQVSDQTEIPVLQMSSQKDTGGLVGKVIKKLKNKKVFIIFAIFIVAIVTAFILINREKDSYSLAVSKLNKARESYAQGDLQNTEKNLYESLVLYSNNPDAVAALIDTIANQGNQSGTEKEAYEKGKRYIVYGQKYFPNNVPILLASGYLYETSGQYDAALKNYEKALEIDPNNEKGLFRKAHVLEFLGRKDEADRIYESAYLMYPGNPYILIAIGNKLVSDGKIDEAVKTYKKASDNPEAPNSVRAEALTDASIARTSQIIHMQEAVSLAKSAIKIDPKFSPALAQYANVMFLNGDAKSAGEYMGLAIQANPRISKNYNLVAQMLRYNKKFGDAINYHKEAIARVADDNTLLGPHQINGAKAYYTYDLAKTYDMSGLRVDIIPLLTTAVQTNSNLKSILRNDFERNGIFKTLGSDQRFIALLE